MIQPRGAFHDPAASSIRTQAGTRPMGSHRNRRQPGHRRGGICAARSAGGRRRRLEPLDRRRSWRRLDADRTLVRGSCEPLRPHRRTVPLHASRIRSFCRIRSRLDDVVYASGQLGVGDQRARIIAWLLLARSHGGFTAHAPDHGNHYFPGGDQRSRHPPEQLRRQPAHGREARAARCLHPGRDLLRGLEPAAPRRVAVSHTALRPAASCWSLHLADTR
jgi:hypothetical protein